MFAMWAFGAQMGLVQVAGPLTFAALEKHRKKRAFRKCRPRKHAKTSGFRHIPPRMREKRKTLKNMCFCAAGAFGAPGVTSKKHTKIRAIRRRARKRHAKTSAFWRVFAENMQKQV